VALITAVSLQVWSLSTTHVWTMLQRGMSSTIHYCSSCFLLTFRQTSVERETRELIKLITEQHIY